MFIIKDIVNEILSVSWPKFSNKTIVLPNLLVRKKNGFNDSLKKCNTNNIGFTLNE